jgi:hypothetical protein
MFDDPSAASNRAAACPSLAAEMYELKQRRARGEARLDGMRRSGAERGIVPGGQPGPVAARGAGYVYGLPHEWSDATNASSALAIDPSINPNDKARVPDAAYELEEIEPFTETDELFSVDAAIQPARRNSRSTAYGEQAATHTRAERSPRTMRAMTSMRHGGRDPERPNATTALLGRSHTTAAAAARELEYLDEEPFADITPHVIDLDVPPAETETHAIAILQTKTEKRAPVRGAFAAAVWLLRLLIGCALAAVGFLAWTQFIQPRLPTSSSHDIKYIIEETMVEDWPGHIVKIPGEEGAKIVIRELAHTYTVVGGYATIEVPDYRFYEDISDLTVEKLRVTLTPSLEGTQPLTPIMFDVEIPLSPVAVVMPKSQWSQVSTAVGTIQLNVTPGSTVKINGEDVSDTMDDNGTLTSSQPVQAIGDNVISISVAAPHSRTNNMSVTFYRAPMEIPLELKEDTGSRSSVSNKNVSTPAKDNENYFLINATTLAGAAVTIETPHKNLDTSKLETTGAFSFMPVFDKIGDNVVRISAAYPGKADSTLEHTVYYMPPASEYSKRAWALSATDYRELLNNISRRIGQIYLCQGRIIKIISETPQLAIMDTGKSGQEQLVLLENKSLDTWVLGEEYRIFADVSGMYDTMPRMMGRYTYLP